MKQKASRNKNDRRFLPLFPVFIFVTLTISPCSSQTTGKIAGRIIDAKTSDPLPGANVLIVGTLLGAATDNNGEFFVINIPPGKYQLKISMIGYESVIINNLDVSVNRTTIAHCRMNETALLAQEMVVTADKISMRKDQTSSIRNVSSTQISALPVENLDAVVEMQAGVVAGHFRGGRLGEVSYLIDGMQVNEAFGGGRAVQLEKEVVSDVEVTTGTFNAEYGNAMSGVVNSVTKDGANEFHGSASANAANYYTNNKDVFIGLKDDDFLRTKDYRLYLEGPIFKDRLTFVANGRLQDNQGAFNGIRRFQPSDYSSFQSADSSEWYSEYSGDSAVVPMSTNKNLTFFGKLSFQPFAPLRTSLTFSLNDEEGKWYNHYFKYNPDGRSTYYDHSIMYVLQANHTISNSLFYEAKVSYVKSSNKDFVHENLYDSRYLHDEYSRDTGAGFSTGGQEKGYNKRVNKNYNAKYDLTWQLNKNHIFKSGFLYTQYDFDQFQAQIRNKYFGESFEYVFVYDSLAHKRIYPYYEPIILENSVYSDIYQVKPAELSAYVQDKMEYEDMVINLGLRLDLFDPKTTYPSQLRNPANQLSFPNNPDYMSTYPKAKALYQISPRFGISYKLGSTALLRFSYGHFFQMPPFYALYTNHDFIVPPQDYGVTMGNPLLRPQKTIQYEVGLWQQLMEGMSLEIAVYYRDIYDLLSTKIITTFNQIRYGLYSNKDYGNAKGLELKYEIAFGPLTGALNYTLQYTRGNADNPTFSFNRAGENKDPVNILIPMSWDQRHTLNATVGYNTENYGSSMTVYYNSGTPYTWSPLSESSLYLINLFPNNSAKPAQVSVDLVAFYTVWSSNQYKVRLSLLGTNMLDALREEGVYSRTGRAYTDIVRDIDIQSHRSNFTDYFDVVQNPSMYGPPRSVKVGLNFIF